LIFAIRIGQWLTGPTVFFCGWCLIVDVFIAACLLAAVIKSNGVKPFGVRLQFSLSGLLSLVVALSAVMGVATQERALFAQQRIVRMEVPPDYETPGDLVGRRVLQPFAVRLPLYLATGCLVYELCNVLSGSRAGRKSAAESRR
jgi:hypothetical protein